MLRHQLRLVTSALLAAVFAAPVLAQTVLPGPGVYDATGRYAGNLIEQNQLLLKFADGEAVLPVGDEGVPEGGSAKLGDVGIVYTTSDCTGTAYATVVSSPMVGRFDKSTTAPPAGYAAGGTVYYVKRPYQTITARSQSSADLTPFRSCMQLNPGSWFVGAVGSQPLPALKLPLTVR